MSWFFLTSWAGKINFLAGWEFQFHSFLTLEDKKNPHLSCNSYKSLSDRFRILKIRKGKVDIDIRFHPLHFSSHRSRDFFSSLILNSQGIWFQVSWWIEISSFSNHAQKDILRRILQYRPIASAVNPNLRHPINDGDSNDRVFNARCFPYRDVPVLVRTTKNAFPGQALLSDNPRENSCKFCQ